MGGRELSEPAGERDLAGAGAEWADILKVASTRVRMRWKGDTGPQQGLNGRLELYAALCLCTYIITPNKTEEAINK